MEEKYEFDNLHNKIVDVQQRLKVPKTEKNDFANFDYRTLSAIEDKVKPLLKEHNLIMWFEDEVVEVGGRVYLKATVKVTDGTEDIVQASAYAREATAPKAKMDDAQLTGSCSTYARKYAVSGLFLIDDSKDDPDAISGKPEPKKAVAPNELTKLKTEILTKYKESGKESSKFTDFLLQTIGLSEVKTIADAKEVLDALN